MTPGLYEIPITPALLPSRNLMAMSAPKDPHGGRGHSQELMKISFSR